MKTAPTLTPRETELLQLVAEGMTNQAIADALHLSIYTVKDHLKSISLKLGTANRGQAVAVARQLQLMPSNAPQDIRHNLPYMPLPLMGRERERADLMNALASPDHRLITLHGIGGVGKTHLAVEAARGALALFPDGVLFVPLSELESIHHLQVHIANWFALEPDEFFNDLGQALLIFDNFEHLEDSKAYMQQLLRATAHTKVIVTSRTHLNVLGETVYPVMGLDEQTTAVELFIENAQRQQFNFQPDDRPTIQQICQALQGMPLAILLASGWVTHCNPKEILSDITQGKLIQPTGGKLYDVFETSWRLLAPQLQETLKALSIFGGSITHEATLTVGDTSNASIRLLVSKSMLQYDQHYSMHELLKQFISDKLHDDINEIMQKHFQFFYGCAQANDTHTLEIHYSDLRRVIEWAAGFEQPDIVAEFCVRATHLLWDRKPYYADFIEWYDTILHHADTLGAVTQAQLIAEQGAVYRHLGRLDEAEAKLNTALRVYQQEDATTEQTDVYITLGYIAMNRGQYSVAIEHYQAALSIAERRQDATQATVALNGMGLAACECKEYEFARQHFLRARDHLHGVNDKPKHIALMTNIGTTYLKQGDYADAHAYYREALRMAEADNYPIGRLIALANLGEVAFKEGKWSEAYGYHLQSLLLADENDYLEAIVHQIEGFAMLASAQSDAPTAVRFFSVAAETRRKSGLAVPPRDQEDHQEAFDHARRHLSEAHFDILWQQGIQTPLADIIEEIKRSS